MDYMIFIRTFAILLTLLSNISNIPSTECGAAPAAPAASPGKKDERPLSNPPLPLVIYGSEKSSLSAVFNIIKSKNAKALNECLREIINSPPLSLPTDPCYDLRGHSVFVFVDSRLNSATLDQRYFGVRRSTKRIGSQTTIRMPDKFHNSVLIDAQLLNQQQPTDPDSRAIKPEDQSSIYQYTRNGKNQDAVLKTFADTLMSDRPIVVMDISKFQVPGSFINDFLLKVENPYVGLVINTRFSAQRTIHWYIEEIREANEVLILRRLQSLPEKDKPFTHISGVGLSQLFVIMIFAFAIICGVMCMMAVPTPTKFSGKGLSVEKLY